MMHRPRFAVMLLSAALAVCAWAADMPGDESTNRKLLKTWLEDTEHADRLKRNLAAFNAMSRSDQARVRQLDKSLHDLDADTRARLQKVMERYVDWLARLPEADRERVEAAAPGAERLAIVTELLDHQWQESLPKYDRNRLAVAEPLERAILLDELRQREDDWRRMRSDSRRRAEEQAIVGNLPISSQDFRSHVQQFVEESLRPLLSDREEGRLNSNPNKNNARYLALVAELAEGKQSLPFPGPAPSGKKKAYRYWKDLPPEIVKAFPVKDLNNPPPSITKADGKWPDLPLAVVEFARERTVEIPTGLLGPTRLNEMPPSVQKFVKDELMPKLTEAERKQLAAAESKWPDYPKAIKNLADRHLLPVPGIALPGEREAWQRLRNFKPGGRLSGGT